MKRYLGSLRTTHVHQYDALRASGEFINLPLVTANKSALDCCQALVSLAILAGGVCEESAGGPAEETAPGLYARNLHF